MLRFVHYSVTYWRDIVNLTSTHQIPTRCITWPTSGLRRVSVNSFGFGGTNSHVILDDALHYLQDRGLAGIHHSIELALPGPSAAERRVNGASYRTEDHLEAQQTLECAPRLLIWSAGDSNSAGRILQAHEQYFAEHIAGNEDKLSQLAYTLAARRSAMAWRSFAVCGSGDMTGALGLSLNATKPIRCSMDELGTAFIFTGQGAQYPAMGAELLVYPEFKASLQRSDSILKSLGCGWSLFGQSLTPQIRNMWNDRLTSIAHRQTSKGRAN